MKLSLKNNFTTVMRIKSLRLERYHCARRWLKKETEREIDGSHDRSLLFWFAFEPQWVYAVLIQQLLQISFLSNFVFAHRLLRRSCSLRNPIQSGCWQSESRLFSLLKYHCSSQSSHFLGNHPKQCKF